MPNYLVLIAFAATLGAACDSDDPIENSGADATTATATALINYSDVTLPDLGSDYVYEGWLIVDDAPVTAGRFTVDANGVMTPAEFSVDADQADRASVFVLTVEPATGDAPEPASTHILAGAISGGASSLVTDHPAALDTDFATAAGSYILATPTTGDDTVQEQGIWWLSPGDPATAGLDLPTLPDGWAYEGWIVGADGPVSTGRFTDAAGMDGDGAGSTKGPVGDGPPFPGQDFITPATVLNNGATVAVISVEPEPDNAPAPFLIKPLVHDPIGAAVAPTEHTMVNNAAATLPAATIQIAAE
jgi:hypothetical protein